MARRTNTEIMNYAIALAAQEADEARAEAEAARNEAQGAKLKADAWEATARTLERERAEAEGKGKQARNFASSIAMAADATRQNNRRLRLVADEACAALNVAIDDLETGRMTIADFCHVARAWAMAWGDA